jgi:HSP20 family protein
MKKPSFFSRLTGADADTEYGYFKEQGATKLTFEGNGGERHAHINSKDEDWQGDEPQGELAVDVYQTPDAIVVKALVAGVQPNSIDIALTREMLTISGTREDEREVDEENYFQRELYWGSFSRTILLPEEVDVDMAEASEKHGILMIRLPKVNKKKQTKLKVRSR